MNRVTMLPRSLIILLMASSFQSAVKGFNNVHSANCNTASRVPDGVSIQFILLPPVIGNCVFIFRSSPETILELKLISVGVDANPLTLTEHCSNSTLINNYRETSRIQLIDMICSKESLQTNRNIAVVSPLNNGFFVIEVRAIEKRLTYSRLPLIAGMSPPTVGAKDFFQIIPNSETEIRAVPINRPSFHFNASFTAPYPGRPTPIIDLTYNFSIPMQTVESPMNGSSNSEGQDMLTEISTSETPTPAKGTSTFVEINISNSTATAG